MPKDQKEKMLIEWKNCQTYENSVKEAELMERQRMYKHSSSHVEVIRQ